MKKTIEHGVIETIHRRTTPSKFRADDWLSDETIKALIEDAVRAPSSFNIQHWRFIAVREPEAKARLCEAAYGQDQVVQAAATLIVLGDTRGFEILPDIMDMAIARGAIPEGRAASWVHMAREIYTDPTLARDEAIRSCSLAAMNLMLAADVRGLAAGALTGFDPERLRREFKIPKHLVPVMLLAIGHADGPRREPMPRLPLARVLSFDRLGDW